ncbi:MAG: ribosome assembly RNA-binding protein YhbY [Candidatus Eisenbacteria bacterium]|uniref:Ribosome assembly RNA-binding protein YhbY n=1 Tax=Eiseniibacteriota bacterium TaxID=2212470 RepID=A0A956SDZ1_UNCEI|nr:ribosome assembly RNA-binding protein YhbY [Candidatus Eisenbacteria bacterium]
MTDSASAAPNRFGLTGKDKRHLRSLGNQMRPAVMIGQEGLTDAVFRAIDQAHRGNELIKLKILEPGDVDRKAIARELDDRSDSQVVGMVGGTILLYRRKKEPKILLPSKDVE